MTKDKTQERFKYPANEKLIEIAILFNGGRVEKTKLVDMVAYARLLIDRLYENGDISKKSSKE